MGVLGSENANPDLPSRRPACSCRGGCKTDRCNEISTLDCCHQPIPPADTPGARGAKLNEHMDLVLSEETREVQQSFLRGLAWIDMESNQLYKPKYSTSSTPTPAWSMALTCGRLVAECSVSISSQSKPALPKISTTTGSSDKGQLCPQAGLSCFESFFSTCGPFQVLEASVSFPL